MSKELRDLSRQGTGPGALAKAFLKNSSSSSGDFVKPLENLVLIPNPLNTNQGKSKMMSDGNNDDQVDLSDAANGNVDVDNDNPEDKGTTSSKTRSKRPVKPSSSELKAAIAQAKRDAQIKGRSNSNAQIIIKDHLEPARQARNVTRDGTGLVFDLRMIEHRNLWDPKHLECPERFASVMERCALYGLLDRCNTLPARPATQEEILKVHTAEHLAKLKEICSSCGDDVNKLEEVGSNYNAVYFHPSTFELTLLACGSTIDLVRNITEGKNQNGMAIIRPPGHHAMKSEFCGYCYVNNVGVAAKIALDSDWAQKILIVDFDVHHGQATQQMFYDDPRVLYFSSHRFEHGMFWPNLEESNYNWIGSGGGVGFNCNVPLNKIGMENADYLAIWHQILLPMACQFNPDLVIVSAGFDAALGCPEGEMRVTPQCYPHLISPLLALANGKVAVILEGGYCIKSLAEGAALTLRTLLGDPCPVIKPAKNPKPELVETILNVQTMLSSKWMLGVPHFLESEAFQKKLEFGQAHLPKLKFLWDEPVPKFWPTRDYLPVQSPEVFAALSLELDQLILNTSLVKAQNKVGLVYDDIMLRHRNTTEPAHPERPERISNIYACHGDYGLLERCYRIQPRKATEEELLLVHTEEHVLKMKNTQRLGSTDLRKLEDRYTSIFLNGYTYESALFSAGSILQVVDDVANGVCQSGVAIVRPPGHHAESDEACGFCIFNNVAVAAKYAINVHGLQRILIVDWDVHHGNGIQRMFEDDPRVLYISIHRYDDGTFYPASTDANYTEVGVGKGQGFNINVPWNKKGMGDTEYTSVFHNIILPVAYEYGPELVFVSAGFDAANGDPLGGCKVSPEGYAFMTHMLSPLANGKIILALEGGYNLTSIAYSMSMCTKALLGDPIPPLALNPQIDPSALESIQNVVRVHSEFWTSLGSFTKALPATCPVPVGTYDSGNIENLTQSLKSVVLEGSPGSAGASIDSDNGNTVQRTNSGQIPDAPPASGEPSLLFPRGLNPILGGRIPTPNSQPSSSTTTSIGGGESTRPSTVESTAPLELQGAEPEPSTSAGTGATFVLEIDQDAFDGSSPGRVIPLRWCRHLGSVNPVPEEGLDASAVCQDCGSPQENWVCLTCYSVHCGRFVREHMVMHSVEMGHCVVLSYADLSVWCYACESYVDCDILNPAKSAAYRSKFGEEMPVPH